MISSKVMVNSTLCKTVGLDTLVEMRTDGAAVSWMPSGCTVKVCSTVPLSTRKARETAAAASVTAETLKDNREGSKGLDDKFDQPISKLTI